jgi:hypothetical protein
MSFFIIGGTNVMVGQMSYVIIGGTNVWVGQMSYVVIGGTNVRVGQMSGGTNVSQTNVRWDKCRSDKHRWHLCRCDKSRAIGKTSFMYCVPQ